MRVLASALAAIVIPFTASAASAQERNTFVQGFGGLRLGTVAVTNTAFGGVVGADLIPSVQVVGEAGRLSDVLPNTVSTLLTFSPVTFHVSAWYAQGGVRFTAPTRSGIRPYVETSAGFARLQNEFGGIGSPLADTLTQIGLRLLDRTEPMTTIGGGIVLRGGALVADMGYRYRRIFAPDLVDALLTGGRLDMNEVRVGVGIRF